MNAHGYELAEYPRFICLTKKIHILFSVFYGLYGLRKQRRVSAVSSVSTRMHVSQEIRGVVRAESCILLLRRTRRNDAIHRRSGNFTLDRQGMPELTEQEKLERRRQKRQQRILNSAENRLNKITGTAFRKLSLRGSTTMRETG